MRIAIGSDHAGFRLKEHFITVLREDGHEVDDLGTDSEVAVDYPIYCSAVGREVAAGRVERGIVLGGSGQGEQLSANKVKGVRAASATTSTPPSTRVATTMPMCCRSARGWWVRDWPTRSSGSGSPPRSRVDATSVVSTRSPRLRTEKYRREHRIRRAGRDRSRDRRHHPARAAAPEHHDPTHRVGELHVAGGAGRAGLGAHQQVLRGLPGEALLRRQPGGRRGRGARARPALRAVRCRARQRATALRRQRQHGGVPRAARTRRQGDGDAPRPGRPPHARFAGELQRAALRLRVVRSRSRVRAHRPRRAPGARGSPNAPS